MNAPAASVIDPAAAADGAETRRQLGICNICNYCNGLCAVFSAAERRHRLTPGDLDHLANLCHHCRSCLYDCQYAPPHAFAVNLPRALARQRWHSYARYAWPRALAGSFAGHGRRAGLLAAAVVLAFTLAVVLTVPAPTLFAAHAGPGAFYAVVPLSVMTAGGVLSLGFALFAIAVGVRRFWRTTAPAPRIAGPGRGAGGGALAQAALDLLTLKHQSGGGPGCADLDHRPSRRRRRFHHALFYGFLLCLGATTVAALRHHVLGQPAPYPLLSAPVLLGTAGGIGMVVGCIGLLWLRRREDPAPTHPPSRGADVALTWLLLAVAATGLALLALRGTSAMGLLLAVHLGTVLALFVLLPYTKMVHGAYRAAALLRDAMERAGH